MNQGFELTSQYRCLISKLDQLLRCYKIAKKNDKNNVLQERVKVKAQDIVNKLKKYPSFEPIHFQCRKKIDLALRDQLKELSQKPKVIDPKKPFGAGLSSGFSSMSSQSSNSSKKQAAQQKPKSFTPLERTPKILKQQVISEAIKMEAIKQKNQTPNPIIQTLKPSQVMPPAKQKIEQKGNSDGVIQCLDSSKQSIKEKANRQANSFSSIQNLKDKVNKSRGSHESGGSQEQILNLLDSGESLKDYHFLLHKPNTNGKQQLPMPKEEDQEQSQASFIESTGDTIVKFCSENKEKLNSQLQFNQDIFDHIRDQQGNFVYVYGVNKPEGKKAQKLYVCTIMKFSANQAFKCDHFYQKQYKDFKNNIRTPMGMIIRGESAAAIQPEFVKFLLNIQCPFPTVLVLRDYQGYDGILCHFNQKMIGKIRITPRKQLGQCSEQLFKNTVSLPFNQSFLPKEKTRYVITKSLNRTIVTPVQEAPNAIHISDNECIRQQKNSFNYKLHSKFFGTKPDYAIYYVNNGVVNVRKDFKDFQLYKKQVLCLQPKIPIILSLCISRDVNPVKKQFLQLAFQSTKIRDPMIFLHLSSLKQKKTVVVTLKSDVTLQMIQKMEPMQIKNFEKDNNFTYCVLIIGKNNLKEYQDPKSQLN